jgi:hypothetical protein
MPFATVRQRPLAWPVLAFAHAMHVPAQPLSQQKPSMQLPLVHSPAPPHMAPFAFCGTQAPAAQ